MPVARPLDVTVVVPPLLRAVFEGRREVRLGVPDEAGVGEVIEALLSLYPRLSQCFAGDRLVTGGHCIQVVLDERAFAELAVGGRGLSTGRRVVLFSVSRPSAPSPRPGA
jgi:hypothetical protein